MRATDGAPGRNTGQGASHEARYNPGDDDAPGAVSFDPFADLLLGLIAILVPVISLLLASGAGTPQAADAALPPAHVIATAAGLRVEADAARTPPLDVPLGHILEDEGLARRLRGVRDRGEPLLLDIAADGLEAAFLFETVAARHGPPVVRQRRLEARTPGARP
ncbi:hypothetical protein ACUSIJ_08380 [Pseudochelatococcus sp. B33]